MGRRANHRAAPFVCGDARRRRNLRAFNDLDEAKDRLASHA